ncbi:hypothetical protein [Nonomuraea deserti]|nr:hypothetical protein [Nonomuraea deserti]
MVSVALAARMPVPARRRGTLVPGRVVRRWSCRMSAIVSGAVRR